MKNLLFRAACVLTLLLAQQSALVHAVSHFARVPGSIATPAAVKPHGKNDAPIHAERCALDPTFSSVLGGAPSASPATVPHEDRFVQQGRRPSAHASIERLSSFPRGPPARL